LLLVPSGIEARGGTAIGVAIYIPLPVHSKIFGAHHTHFIDG
jgi:hypothetical protein